MSSKKQCVQWVLLGLWLTGLSATFPASAQSSDLRGCADPPASSLVVSVAETGAAADGTTDDTIAIQRAIDEVAGTGGTVLVPDGTYMVNAAGRNGLTLKSNMTLRLSAFAILKAIPSRKGAYSIISISGASDVTVVGGTLDGDRDRHLGTSGEWGMGIRVEGGSKRVTISEVAAKKMWGDGFYVLDATDVRFCGVTATGNRRQGLSVIDADGVTVTHSSFSNTEGVRPAAGIDLEPNDRSQRITNVRIENSSFIDNSGAGVQIAGKKGHVSAIVVANNEFRGAPAIDIENAPHVRDSSICNNRQVSSRLRFFEALVRFTSLRDTVVIEKDCESRGQPRPST